MSKAKPIAAMAQISHWIGVRRVPGTVSAICIRTGEKCRGHPTGNRCRPDDRVYFTMVPFDFSLRTRTIFGRDAALRTGVLARDLGFRRTLVPPDSGIAPAGHAAAIRHSLEAASISVLPFSDF